MKSSKLFILTIAIVANVAVLAPTVNGQTANTLNASDTTQDFHIDKDGYVKISQAKVFQIAGTSFYVRYYIGLAFIRMLVKNTADTKVYRRFGDEVLLSDIHEGDTINVEGKIETGVDSLSIVATKLINFSNQKEIAGFKGIISGNGTTTDSFILTTKNQGTITIQTNPKTQIKKGTRILTTNYIHDGDQVIDTTGTFDHGTQTLDADVIVIYTDMNIYKERNFQGTLKTITAGSPPAITFTVNGKDYSVALAADALIMNNKRKPVSLERFIAGDTIRIYGNIREVDDPIIDAQVIRNLDL